MIYIILLVCMTISGIAMGGLSALARSEWMRKYQERSDKVSKIPEKEHQLSVVTNSAVSTVMVFGVAWLAHDALFVAEARHPLRMALEAIGILALYDFGYYVLHRFVFHEWKVGRRIHAVHHRIRTPYAIDSLYIHPVETILGLGLLLVCTWIVGPVSVYSFGVCFLVYSVWNVFIHSAFHLPFFPFRGLTAMVDHHDVHHSSMKGGYYASITPVFDILFGTAKK